VNAENHKDSSHDGSGDEKMNVLISALQKYKAIVFPAQEDARQTSADVRKIERLMDMTKDLRPAGQTCNPVTLFFPRLAWLAVAAGLMLAAGTVFLVNRPEEGNGFLIINTLPTDESNFIMRGGATNVPSPTRLKVASILQDVVLRHGCGKVVVTNTNTATILGPGNAKASKGLPKGFRKQNVIVVSEAKDIPEGGILLSVYDSCNWHMVGQKIVPENAAAEEFTKALEQLLR